MSFAGQEPPTRSSTELAAVEYCQAADAPHFAECKDAWARLAAKKKPERLACPEGYVCLTVAEMAEVDRALIRLDAEVQRLKTLKQRRLGWTVGCGAGVGPAIGEGGIEAEFDAGCGLYWGIRF